MKKKCVLSKLGTKKHQLGKHKRGNKTLTPNERVAALTKWRNSWFENN
tara:strand:- start:1451 stop:1594 length:144 start_codon:yes stop_codon:yes gene_type:complete